MKSFQTQLNCLLPYGVFINLNIDIPACTASESAFDELCSPRILRDERQATNGDKRRLHGKTCGECALVKGKKRVIYI